MERVKNYLKEHVKWVKEIHSIVILQESVIDEDNGNIVDQMLVTFVDFDNKVRSYMLYGAFGIAEPEFISASNVSNNAQSILDRFCDSKEPFVVITNKFRIN